MLNDLSFAQEGRRLCGEEWIFHQGNAAIHNASMTKNYLLEPQVRILNRPAGSPDFNPIEKVLEFIAAKVYEGRRQYAAISELLDG